MNPRTAYQRGLLLYRQGRHELAVAEFSRVLVEEPNDAGVHAMIARCHAAQERWAEAQRAADTAVALDPEDATAHYARASVLLGRGRLVHAGQAVYEALRLEPHNPDFWALRAIITFNSGSYAGSADAASRGLAVDPAHVECLCLLARALNQMGDSSHIAGADASMRAALSHNPDSALVHCDAGQLLLERGRSDQAFGYFREALRLDPTLAPAREGLLACLRGRHRLYRTLLRFFLFTPESTATRRIAGPVLTIGGALVVWKGLSMPAPAGHVEVVFGTLFLLVGVALLLGEPVLNWLVGHKRW